MLAKRTRIIEGCNYGKIFHKLKNLCLHHILAIREGFSHENIVKIKLPRQNSCKHEHLWLNFN